MKLLALLLASAALSGCVAYPYGAPAPYYDPGVYSSGYYGGYYGPGPFWAYPSTSVIIDGRRHFHGRPHHGTHDGRHRGGGDRDRDGIPNRLDRDRDGDGVPNRLDRRPWNPRRN